MKRAIFNSLVLVALVAGATAGCTKVGATGPSTTADGAVAPGEKSSTTASAPATETSATTASTTSTTPALPSQFAQTLADADQPVHLAWSDERPAAGPATVGDGWVAFAAYAGGTRRDVVLDRATGAELWSRRATSSVAAAPSLRAAPLVIDDVFIHLEPDGAQSEGALLQGIDVTSGETLWTTERPAWFPSPLFECGTGRVCAMTWENYGRNRKIVEYDAQTGRLIAQGPAGTAGVLLDVDIVDPAPSGANGDDYPRPPATIPDLAGAENPTTTTTPPKTTNPPTTSTAAPTTTSLAPPAPPTTPAPPPTTPAPTTPPTPPPSGAAAAAFGQTDQRAGAGVAFHDVDSWRRAAPTASDRLLVRFGGAGNRRWELQLDDLFEGIGDDAVPSASLDHDADVLILGSPPGSARPDQDTVYGIDYETGQVLWEAPNRSLNCWQWLLRPTNLRCEITGTIESATDDDGNEVISGYRNVEVEFEAFDPRSGQTLGSVAASFPDWDGQGDRPSVPAKTWYVEGGLIIESDAGVVGLSMVDGEVLPLLAAVTAWCEQPPVDNDGEIYPGFYPCQTGDPTRARVDGELSAMPAMIGAFGADGAIYIQGGNLTAVGFGAAPASPGSVSPDPEVGSSTSAATATEP